MRAIPVFVFAICLLTFKHGYARNPAHDILSEGESPVFSNPESDPRLRQIERETKKTISVVGSRLGLDASREQIENGVREVERLLPELRKLRGQKIPDSIVSQVFKATFGTEPNEVQLNYSRSKLEEAREHIFGHHHHHHHRKPSEGSKDGNNKGDEKASSGEGNPTAANPGPGYNDPTVRVVNIAKDNPNNSSNPTAAKPSASGSHPTEEASGGAENSSTANPSLSVADGGTPSLINGGTYAPPAKTESSPKLSDSKFLLDNPEANKPKGSESNKEAAPLEQSGPTWHPLSVEGAPKLNPESKTAEISAVPGETKAGEESASANPNSGPAADSSLSEKTAASTSSILSLFETNNPLVLGPKLVNPSGGPSSKDALTKAGDNNKYAAKPGELVNPGGISLGGTNVSSSSGTSGSSSSSPGGVLQNGIVATAGTSKIGKEEISKTLDKVFASFKSKGGEGEARELASGESIFSGHFLADSISKVENQWKSLFGMPTDEDLEDSGEANGEERSPFPLAIGVFLGLATLATAGETIRRYRVAKSLVSPLQESEDEAAQDLQKGA